MRQGALLSCTSWQEIDRKLDGITVDRRQYNWGGKETTEVRDSTLLSAALFSSQVLWGE